MSENSLIQADVINFENDAEAAAILAYKAVKGFRVNHYKYPPDAEGLRQFQERTEAYFDFVVKANLGDGRKAICADVEGWVTSLGITRQTLSVYYHSRSVEWKEYIDYVKDCIVSMKKQFMFNGRTSPIAAIFDLTNNHHYYNTSSFTPERIEARSTINKEISFEQLKKLGETGSN